MDYVISYDYHQKFSKFKNEEEFRKNLIKFFKREKCPKPKRYTQSTIRFQSTKPILHFKNELKAKYGKCISFEIFYYIMDEKSYIVRKYREHFDNSVNSIYDN